MTEHLRGTFQRAGHGSMGRVAQALGMRETFYSEKWGRKRFDVGVLTATLRALGVSRAAFFAELEPGGRGLWAPDAVTERSSPATRAAVGLAYRRMRAELGNVDLIAELEAASGESEPVAPVHPLDAAWIEELDGRRQDEPEAVASELAAGLDRVEAALLPRTLGVWSSALRLVLDLEAASYVNRQALRLAEADGDSATSADLLIRRSYIAVDGGDPRAALTLAQLAAGIYSSIGDRTGHGRALADCGRCFFYLDLYRESVAAHREALELLPESLHEYRFASLQTLGLVCLELGELDRAEEVAELAEPLATTDHRRVKLRWLKARILRKGNRLNEAETCLRSVVEMFRKIHSGDAALAACELVQVDLEQRKPAEARQVCLGMIPFLESLRANPVVDAAVGELVRAGVRGSLSLELVKKTIATIKAQARDARTRRQWRALAVASS